MDFKGIYQVNQETIKRFDREIKISEKFFISAKKNFGIKEHEMTIIAAYNSLFHCCRALLFEKGYTEKNHFCLIVSLQNLYHEDKTLLEFLNSINKVRISRHQVQYRGDMADKEEAEYVLDLTKKFLNYIKVKLKSLK